MPNAINTRFKGRQSIKTDKENENIELKRKTLKCSVKDKLEPVKCETAWNRISKLKKVPSIDASLAHTARSHTNLIPTKSTQRLQTMRAMINHRTQSPRPPLTPTQCGILKRPRGKRSARSPACVMANSSTECEKEESMEATFKTRQSVTEIMTARSLNHSKSSSEDYKICGSGLSFPNSPSSRKIAESDCSFNSLLTHSNLTGRSNASQSDYKLAPLIKSASQSYYELNSSSRIISNLRHLLRKKKRSMEPDELEVVKKVIKSDNRYRELDRHNPALFKDILRTQLESILKHETVIKTALTKLDSSENLHSIKSSHKHVCCGGSHEPKKLELDVVFKNVPTLEKEIIILRALGEKLEATLNRSSSQRMKYRQSPESLSLASSTSQLSKSSVRIEFVDMLYEPYVCFKEQQVVTMAEIWGIVLTVGAAKEFRMARKTIVELKEDANKPFYIPVNEENTELKRTSFKKLKENPDVLLRHIKAKSPIIPFNILDQDPVFFNNILNNKPTLKISLDNSDKNVVVDEVESKIMLCEGGDSRTYNQNPTELNTGPKIEEVIEDDISPPVVTTNTTFKKIGKSAKKSKTGKFDNTEEVVILSDAQQNTNKEKNREKLFEPPLRGKENRKRIRSSVTPMPMDVIIEPKNNILKTILIGTAQISVFLLLIMAFTYPNPIC